MAPQSSTFLKNMKLPLFNLNASGKDIPIPNRTTYIKKLMLQTEVFLKNMRWRETTSHSFARSCLTSPLTLVNTVLCVCI